jgi:hypothetical protein
MSTRASTWPTTRLAEEFAKLAMMQNEAGLYGDQRRVNALYWQMDEIAKELKSRSGDQRTSLLPLLRHPNAHVRWKAAAATLAVAPKEARDALEDIIRNRIFPQALDAGMLLDGLDEASYEPR